MSVSCGQVTPAPRLIEELPRSASDEHPAVHQNLVPKLAQSPSIILRSTNTFDGLDNSHEGLTPLNNVFSLVCTRHLWTNALLSSAVLIRDSTIGGCVGSFVAYLFTFGNFLSGNSATHQSTRAFSVAVIGLVIVLGTLEILIVHAASMLRLHFVDAPHQRPTLANCLWRQIVRTWLVYIVVLAAVIGSSWLLVSLPASLHRFKLHVYSMNLLGTVYSAYLGYWYRRTFVLDTVEGQLHQRTGSTLTSSPVQFVVQVIANQVRASAIVFAAIAFIHITYLIPLETSQDLVVFTAASYVFKFSTQHMLQQSITNQKKIHVMTIYVVAALPAVLIDTQIRVAVIRHPNKNFSVASSIVLCFTEIVYRFIKVWLLRLKIWRHENQTIRRLIRPRKAALTTIVPPSSTTSATNRLRSLCWPHRKIDVDSQNDDRVTSNVRYTGFLEWRRRLILVHAAHNHANMYSEYVAILCSMAISYFFHGHPHYSWSRVSTSANNLGFSSLPFTNQITYIVTQIAMEYGVDCLCTVWEVANGVSVRSPSHVHKFIVILFTACAVTNVQLCAAVYVNTTDQ